MPPGSLGSDRFNGAAEVLERAASLTEPARFAGRLPGLDLLRAVAILVVALHHTWGDAVPEVRLPSIGLAGWVLTCFLS